MHSHTVYVWENGSQVGPGAPVYFPQGTTLCDDGPDKRGAGTSKVSLMIHYVTVIHNVY